MNDRIELPQQSSGIGVESVRYTKSRAQLVYELLRPERKANAEERIKQAKDIELILLQDDLIEHTLKTDVTRPGAVTIASFAHAFEGSPHSRVALADELNARGYSLLALPDKNSRMPLETMFPISVSSDADLAIKLPRIARSIAVTRGLAFSAARPDWQAVETDPRLPIVDLRPAINQLVVQMHFRYQEQASMSGRYQKQLAQTGIPEALQKLSAQVNQEGYDPKSVLGELFTLTRRIGELERFHIANPNEVKDFQKLLLSPESVSPPHITGGLVETVLLQNSLLDSTGIDFSEDQVMHYLSVHDLLEAVDKQKVALSDFRAYCRQTGLLFLGSDRGEQFKRGLKILIGVTGYDFQVQDGFINKVLLPETNIDPDPVYSTPRDTQETELLLTALKADTVIIEPFTNISAEAAEELVSQMRHTLVNIIEQKRVSSLLNELYGDNGVESLARIVREGMQAVTNKQESESDKVLAAQQWLANFQMGFVSRIPSTERSSRLERSSHLELSNDEFGAFVVGATFYDMLRGTGSLFTKTALKDCIETEPPDIKHTAARALLALVNSLNEVSLEKSGIIKVSKETIWEMLEKRLSLERKHKARDSVSPERVAQKIETPELTKFLQGIKGQKSHEDKLIYLIDFYNKVGLADIKALFVSGNSVGALALLQDFLNYNQESLRINSIILDNDGIVNRLTGSALEENYGAIRQFKELRSIRSRSGQRVEDDSRTLVNLANYSEQHKMHILMLDKMPTAEKQFQEFIHEFNIWFLTGAYVDQSSITKDWHDGATRFWNNPLELRNICFAMDTWMQRGRGKTAVDATLPAIDPREIAKLASDKEVERMRRGVEDFKSFYEQCTENERHFLMQRGGWEGMRIVAMLADMKPVIVFDFRRDIYEKLVRLHPRLTLTDNNILYHEFQVVETMLKHNSIFQSWIDVTTHNGIKSHTVSNETVDNLMSRHFPTWMHWQSRRIEKVAAGLLFGFPEGAARHYPESAVKEFRHYGFEFGYGEEDGQEVDLFYKKLKVLYEQSGMTVFISNEQIQ